MSGGIEISSGRKKETGVVELSTPYDLLIKTEYWGRMLREIEGDLHDTPIRKAPERMGGRNYIPVFIALTPAAQKIVKGLYESKGWVIEVDDQSVNFYFNEV